MPSEKKINVDSPRQGIMKSSKKFSNTKKNIKLDFIMSKSSVSIKDYEDSSVKNVDQTS